MKKEVIVISVGGSLIVPDGIDIKFIKNFKKIIIKHLKKGKRFIIICGGGKTARNYQLAANSLVKLNKHDADWLGIHATRLNAHLLKSIFDKLAHPKIIKNPMEKINFKRKILIASGWKPGFSTDYDAVLIAKNLKIRKIANLTNIDYVYDKNPSKFKNAKPIKEILWSEFRKLLPEKWAPGLNTPFDPIAAKETEKLKFEVAIINGKTLKEFENWLENKKFIGTKIV